MNVNFGFPIVDTPLGEGVVLDCISAFLFNNVTGSGYLENTSYPFTTSGLTKLFYNAFNYNFVSGLFHNGSVKNSPYTLSNVKPYIFSGSKIVVPIEFDREAVLQGAMNELFIASANPTDYIIQRIEKSKRGNGMEPFLEYLACETFKRRNYIVENQIPLSHSLGSPDFGAFRIKLNGNTSLSGLHIIELSMIRLGIEPALCPSSSSSLVVGEAKTSTANMAKQLDKYISAEIFDYSYELHPSKAAPTNTKSGLLKIDLDYTIIVKDGNSLLVNEETQTAYSQWLDNYFKLYTLANLTNDELMDFYHMKLGGKLNFESDLIKLVNCIDISDILSHIEDLM